MLKVLSFKIEDADGINEALNKYSLASKMHILVSNGSVLIPVEDGAPKPNAVQIVEIQEQQHILREQKDIIGQSEVVNARVTADIENRINVARAELEAATSAPVKERCKQKLNDAENALHETKTQSAKNQYEIERIDVNLEFMDDQIAKLSK